MTDWKLDLLGADRIAFDIEISDPNTLLCCGFAASTDKSYVFTADRKDEIRQILQSDVPKIAQNACFDVYWLYSRWGLPVRNVTDDTMLAWHALYPELAGQSAQKSYQASRKSLSFLASIFTREPFWKFYSDNEHEMYELNGRDCMVTLEIMQKLDEEIDDEGVRDIYEHNMSLVWPAVEIQNRGLRVDDRLRRERLAKLKERERTTAEEVNEAVLPLIRERKDRLDGLSIGQTKNALNLFKQKWVCDCCRGGSKKSQSCTDCYGVEGTGSDGAIVKDDLIRAHRDYGVDAKLDEMTKDELRDLVPPCEECDGEGKRTWLEFNLSSPSQKAAVLYEILRVPERYNDGTLTTDESALKNLLAEI